MSHREICIRNPAWVIMWIKNFRMDFHGSHAVVMPFMRLQYIVQYIPYCGSLYTGVPRLLISEYFRSRIGMESGRNAVMGFISITSLFTSSIGFKSNAPRFIPSNMEASRSTEFRFDCAFTTLESGRFIPGIIRVLRSSGLWMASRLLLLLLLLLSPVLTVRRFCTRAFIAMKFSGVGMTSRFISGTGFHSTVGPSSLTSDMTLSSEVSVGFSMDCSFISSIGFESGTRGLSMESLLASGEAGRWNSLYV